MTKNITRIPICDGVTFHSIGEKRFKTGQADSGDAAAAVG